MGKLTGTMVAAALLVTGSAPAFAAPAPRGGPAWQQDVSQWGGYHGRGGRYRHRRGGGGIDGGDFLAGAAVAGVLAVLLSSSAKAKREKEAQRDSNAFPVDDSVPAPDYSKGYPGDGRDRQVDQPDRVAASGIISGEDAAVDACATAAEGEAQRLGPNPGIRNIDQVEGSGREWRISGTVETRDGYRTMPVAHRFNCSVRFGQIDHVEIDEGRLALR